MLLPLYYSNIDILIGGGGIDYLEGNMGSDLAAGDCVDVLFQDKSLSFIIQSITSTSADIGSEDILVLGQGNDTAIGGQSGDIINSTADFNILVGDSAQITYYSRPLPSPSSEELGFFWSIPKSIETINCELGGNDYISGGSGTDYIIGGSFDDKIDANEGPDLVFGDHAKIFLYDINPFKLFNATTTDASCAMGEDNITLGGGNDIAFGGSMGDNITGNDGNDVILGDFGRYQDIFEFLPNQFFESLTDYYQFAGADTIHGGAGDDVLMGQGMFFFAFVLCMHVHIFNMKY